MDLRGYTRVLGANDDYTRLGFGPSAGGDGGMIFDALTVDRLQKDGLGRFIVDPDTILPQIQLDLWALTTLANFETHGYVHIKV